MNTKKYIYITKRLIFIVPLTLAISVVVFLLLNLVNGGPIAALIGEKPTTTESVNNLREKFHLNDPIYMQYYYWISGVVHGDLGTSIFTSTPVLYEIQSRLPITLSITFPAFLLSIGFGVFAGTLAALHRGRKVDRITVGAATLMSSSPAFVVAILALYLLGLKLQLFPIFGTGDGGFKDFIWHLTLPILVVSLGPLAFITKLTRAAMLEEIKSDYYMFAIARGLPRIRIVFRYALRNALIPIVTASGLVFVGLLTGTVFVESVFGLPGLGGLLVSSIKQTDIPVIQGIVLIVAVWIIFSNFVVDLLYMAIDPRVNFDKGSD
jgi:peptide/nickel transport system permease protein